MNFITRIFRTEIANQRTRKIRAAFTKLLASDPQHAIEHANTKLDAANRAEYKREIERLPVTL